MMTPNISFTATRIGDNPRSCESKKRHSSAICANVRERSDHVDATFLGITGVRDPQIVALSYSLTLTFQPKPIRALTARSVHNIDRVALRHRLELQLPGQRDVDLPDSSGIKLYQSVRL
jgi:hypothetical protein